MTVNHYNNPDFFKKYSQMSRSTQGLAGAGEWSELQKLLPDFTNKEVLDLGCGYGWHCKFAADHGASHVVGIDVSQKMLAVAEAKNADEHISYHCAAMEDLDYPDNHFDCVISSLAFHYIADFSLLVQNITRWLRPNGTFVFSVEHPVFTARGDQEWFYDANGEKLHFPVDHYYEEGVRAAVFLGETVQKYHWTLTTYLHTLLQAGLVITDVIEPQPPETMMHLPEMKDELRRPMMLLVAARK